MHAGVKKLLLYRPLITALFLGLYLFIATPAAYWHSHSQCQKAAEESPLQVVKAASGSAYCAVCAHEYTDCCNDMQYLSVLSPAVYAVKNGHHPQPGILLTGSRDFNKGPPAPLC